MLIDMDDVVQLLRSIYFQRGHREAIRGFQDLVFGAEEGALGAHDEFLRQLAYDLDFFEPDDRARAEDSSYYGTERLMHVLEDALHLLGQR